MTAKELIAALADLDPDTEIRTATQLVFYGRTSPGWPFEHEIAGIVTEDDLPKPDPADHDGPPTAWLVEGTQIGYLPAEVARAAWNQ